MSISLGTLWAVIIAVVGLILTILNIIDKITVFSSRSKEPDRLQNEKISHLERQYEEIDRRITDQFNKYDGYFEKDRERLGDIEKSSKQTNTIIIRSLQALTANALDGNNIDALKESKRELDDYLLSR